MKRFSLSFGLLASALALSLWGCKNSSEAKEEKKEAHTFTVETAVASTHPMQTSVVAYGTVTAGQGASVRIAPVVAGRLAEVRVKEGDSVQAGDIVAIIDNRPQQRQAQSAEASVKVSQTQAVQSEIALRAQETDHQNSLRQAKLAVRSAEIDRQTTIAQAEVALKLAQTDYEKTKAGARPQEIAQAVQAVAQANATRTRAKTEIDRVQFLYQKGIVPKRQLDDARTTLEVANATWESAKQQLSLLRAGARPEDLKAAELRFQQAQEGLAQARATSDAKFALAEAALRQAQEGVLQVEVKRKEAQALHETVAQKQADLASAREMAQIAEIRTATSGVVTRRNLNRGDMADPATPILEITDTHTLNVVANLPAEEAASLKVGMTASITPSEASPEKVEASHGTLLSIGQIDPQTNLLSVRVSVENREGRIKVGGFVTVSIMLESHPNAVTLPKEALVSREGKSVVFLFGADGVAHQKEVEMGAEQEGLIEIVKGVAVGEKAIRLGQHELTDGAKVQEAKPEAEKEGKKE